MKKSALLVCGALALATGLGCLRVPVSVTASTTPLEGRSYAVLGETSGSVTQNHILGIIPVNKATQLKEAMELARQKAGADALIDVTADYYVKDFVLFTAHTTEVHGKAIKFTGAK